MASVIKSEEEIIADLTKYIESGKKNRPSALSPLKKEARTQKICDLVFANPDTFKLETEIKFVPRECITTNILVKLVLAGPENIKLLNDDLISTDVMVAFEFSKRRTEYISALIWSTSGQKFQYPQKIFEVRDSVSELCDELDLKYDDKELLRDYTLYVNKVSEYIIEFLRKKDDIVLNTVDKVTCKYKYVDINRDKRVLVLISGTPDSGKTTFGRMLSYRINGSVCFDSDELFLKGRDLEPLKSLVDSKVKVVIFSDPYANNYFSESEMAEFDVVNIVVEPKSIELMYRHSKYNQHMPFEYYVECEAKTSYYESYYRDITVINDYDERLWNYVDSTLEDMALLLDFELPPIEEVEEERKLQKI